MSDIKEILISFENLTDEEQVHLWLDLFEFAHARLPADKNLMCFTVDKNDKLHLEIINYGNTLFPAKRLIDLLYEKKIIDLGEKQRIWNDFKKSMGVTK